LSSFFSVDDQLVALLDENDTPLFYNIADLGKLAPGSPPAPLGAVSLLPDRPPFDRLRAGLGSIRVIVDESGNVVSHTDYYPFGMTMTGRETSSLSEDFYKYNGKQLDDDYGLNWHDYGWRPYDAEIGRWVRVDPLADSLSSWSPYVYAFNSPIVFIDLNGLLGYRNDSTGVYQWFDEDPGEGWTMIFPGSKEAWEAGLSIGENGEVTFNQMVAVLFDIRSSGFEAFLRFVNDPNYGTNFFLSAIREIPIEGRFWQTGQSLLLSRQIAAWGHQNLGGFDELRHKIGSFLLASEYGPVKAFIITSGNEYYGLYVIDLPRGRFFDAVLGSKDVRTAFQWQDFRNNIYGIGKAVKFRRRR